MKQGIFMREIVAEAKEVVIDVIGVIGWEVWYPEMRKMLQGIPENIETVIFEIYSPGGSVWEGNAIIQEIGALKQTTIARVQMAASMATLIAVACDEREIAKNGRFLIHNPWQMLAGDSEAMAKAAKELKDCENEAADFYATRTGQKAEDMLALMNEERWMTASETKEKGFVQEINDPFDVESFKGVKAEIVAAGKWPEALAQMPEEDKDNANAYKAGTEGSKTEKTPKPDKSADAKEYTKGYKAGVEDGTAKARLEIAVSHKEEIEKNAKLLLTAAEDVKKRDSLISEKQSECDTATARIKELQASLDTATEKFEKLTAGGLTFSAPVETWEEAVIACDGDYTAARRQYPEAYKLQRAEDKENRNKGGGVMRKLSVFLAVLFGGALIGYAADLTAVDAYQMPELVKQINARTLAPSGNGAVVAAAASVAEGVAETKSTVITLTNCVLTATDGSDEGESQKVYDFPAGAFNLLVSVANCSIVSSAGVTGAVMYVSCGTAAAGDDSDLTGTEADIIPRTTIDASGAGVTTNDFDAILAASLMFDGTGTAKDCYVNLAIDDDNMDADVTNTFSGAITLVWTKAIDN